MCIFSDCVWKYILLFGLCHILSNLNLEEKYVFKLTEVVHIGGSGL
jgi:hypothetical protein